MLKELKMDEYESFIGMLADHGSSLKINVPAAMIKVYGWKAGDDMKVLIKRMRTKEEKEATLQEEEKSEI